MRIFIKILVYVALAYVVGFATAAVVASMHGVAHLERQRGDVTFGD